MDRKLFEGSLEVKLPTIWTDEKQSREEAERREEIRREKSQRRERVRRKKMQMREKVGKSRNTVFFQWFVAPEGRKVGSLKRRVRSQLARWEMKNCTPLWREAHFEVKMYKTHASDFGTTFGSLGALEVDVEKVHAVVARSTFPSQNVQNTPLSDHFWKLRCRKSARRCGKSAREAHFQVKMYKTHQGFGPLLEVQMSFRVAGARDCGPCQKWAKREGFVAFSTTTTTTLHYTTIHYNTLQLHYYTTTTTTHYTSLHSTLHYTPLHYTTLHLHYNYTTLHYTTLHSHYTTLHYTTLHSTTLHYTTLHYTTLQLTTTLHYITLHYITLHYATLHYTTLHYTTHYRTTLHYTTLHYTTLHYTTLHTTTLHYTTLHYTTLHYTEWHCTTDRQVDR